VHLENRSRHSLLTGCSDRWKIYIWGQGDGETAARTRKKSGGTEIGLVKNAKYFDLKNHNASPSKKRLQWTKGEIGAGTHKAKERKSKDVFHAETHSEKREEKK